MKKNLRLISTTIISGLARKDHLLYSLKCPQAKAKFDGVEALNEYRSFRYSDKLPEDHSMSPLMMDELLSFEQMLSKHGVQELVLFTAPFLPNGFHSQSNTLTQMRKPVNA